MESSIKGEVKRLNWDILPKGEYPWEVQKERIEPFLSKVRGNNRQVIINGWKPLINMNQILHQLVMVVFQGMSFMDSRKETFMY